jgi:hypothetical protein
MLVCSVSCWGSGVHHLDPQVLTSRLRAGDQLEIVTGGGTFEVWAEPAALPPSVYNEGKRFDLKDLGSIVERILRSVAEHDGRCRWVED